MDAARARDDPVTGHPLLGHAEVVGLVDDELVELDERAGVEQQLQPLSGCLLSGLVLAADPLLATGQLGLGVASHKLGETFFEGHSQVIWPFGGL